MGVHEETAARRRINSVIFALVLATHAALVFLLSSYGVPRLARRAANDSLVFLTLPERTSLPSERRLPRQGPTLHQPKDLPQARQPAPLPVPQEPPAENPPLTIDWMAEAERTAEQQAQLAAEAHHRALDKHGPGADMDGGLGPEPGKKPEFGWYHARIHRVQALPGGGYIIWINDRCFIPAIGFIGIPFPLCGIGKIPVRGDLFEHMRDPADLGGDTMTQPP